MNLFADRNLRMQVGDKIVVVGPEDAVDRVASLMGNSVKRLDHPNLVTIFVGILVGIIFGSIPFAFPGVPTPVKLGLAGGPLIVAILIGRFGYKFRLVTYVSTSANFMLREFGLALFLASVGIKAGEHFVDTVVAGDGLTYVWTGFLITVIPILIIGVIARMRFKLNYFTIMGLIAGSTTDPRLWLCQSGVQYGCSCCGLFYSLSVNDVLAHSDGTVDRAVALRHISDAVWWPYEWRPVYL